MVILFDIDDTLVDHTGAVRAAADTLHKKVGMTVSAEDFYQAWAEAIKRHFDRFLSGELSYDSQRRARVRDTIDASLSDDAADEIFSVYLASYEEHWFLFPDVLSCLQRLSSYRLGIVSNGQSLQQRLKLERTGIAEMFDCIVISEECGSAKPNEKIFHHACSALGQAPQRAVYVGDLYDVDATAARNAGLTGIWLDRNGQATKGHRPPIIRSLSGLEEAVQAVSLEGAG